MKPKLMKSILLIISFTLLVLSFLGAGCEKDERDPLCYQGKVVSLNQGNGCQNIIEIIETIKDGKFEIGNTLSFNSDLYEGTLKVGDVVFFKVIEYEEFGNPISTQPCGFPQFAALIEFCKN